MKRQEVIREVDRLKAHVQRVLLDLERLQAMLAGDTPQPEVRPYNVPALDAEEIAERFGIDTDPPGEIPEWFAAKKAPLVE